MPRNFDIEMDDDEFVAYALRHGNWERYEHPTKGETFTLQIGEFPLISIHNVLTERERPLQSFLGQIASVETMALLLAHVAKLDYKVSVLTRALAEREDAD